MPDVVDLAAGKSNSTGHEWTSHHVSQDDSNPTEPFRLSLAQGRLQAEASSLELSVPVIPISRLPPAIGCRERVERLMGDSRESWLMAVCVPSKLSLLDSGLGGSKLSLLTAIYPWCAISPRRDVLPWLRVRSLVVVGTFLNRISGRWDVHVRRRAGGQGAG